MMAEDKNDTALIRFYQLQIERCKRFAAISKEARANPVDVDNGSVEEFVKRRNKETCGEDCFHHLEEDFSIMKPVLSEMDYSEIVLDYIEKEIRKAKEMEGYE